MAKRYSGNVEVTVMYQDRGDYKTSVRVNDKTVWRGHVGGPKSGFGVGVDYDSPKAYDRTAKAAITFAEDDDAYVMDDVALDRHGDIHIGRSYATRYPKQENPSRKRKASPKRKIATSFTVSIFDPEAGHFVRYSRMKGASAKDVERRVMAKWGLDADDVKITKPTAKKAR